MPSVPQNVQASVRPFVACPDALWQATVYLESGFNPLSIGDNGTSFGLFQLHRGGQADRALQYIRENTGLTGASAEQYLLTHMDVQARYGMPAINAAWTSLKSGYAAGNLSWWIAFASQSGHPGGNASDPATVSMANKYLSLARQNAFGLQNMSAASTNTAVDNTWLQILINHAPHQPCGVVWRRTCPGAKAAFEGGMDLASPNGTKVYALAQGNVIGAGYFWHPNGNPGHGVVTTRVVFPDGTMGDLYYQHLQLAPNIILCNQTGGQLYGGVVGPPPTYQQIQQGQFLGTIVVGEVEVGINAEWGGVWGVGHPGAWVDDPEDAVRSLMDSGGGLSPRIPLTTGIDPLDQAVQQLFTRQHTGLDTLTKHPGLAGPLQQFHDAQQFRPFSVPDDSNSNAPIIGGIQAGLSYPVRLTMGIFSFLINNILPFFIRSSFSLLAIIIVVALIINITSTITQEEEGEARAEGEKGAENEQPDTNI